MDRFSMYKENGGVADDMVAYRAWLAEYWNMYGAELGRAKNTANGFILYEQDKRQFNHWLYKKLKDE